MKDFKHRINPLRFRFGNLQDHGEVIQKASLLGLKWAIGTHSLRGQRIRRHALRARETLRGLKHHLVGPNARLKSRRSFKRAIISPSVICQNGSR